MDASSRPPRGPRLGAKQTTLLARRLADGPPATLAAIKKGVYRGADSSLPETLAYEYKTQRHLFLAADAREGMQAFLDKRPAKYGNRDD